jgi:peptidyl-tRNA hydrolase, PTH1 family
MSGPPASRHLIAGLGNPGRGFHLNRHNVGFMLVDRLAKDMGIAFRRRQAGSLVTDGRVDGLKVILAKPQGFMNTSGAPVASLVRFFQIPLDHLLIVHDDLDLPLGSLRLRGSGGSAGHRGMQSIVTRLASQEIPRLRIGIGRPPGRMDPADFVLKDFAEGETELLEITLDKAVDCVRTLLLEGLELAMTRFNGQVDEA